MSISEKTVPRSPLTEGSRALQFFTDRHELTKLFAEYLNDDLPHEKILFFHGDGGNGKSLLLKFLLENCCKRFPREIWQQLKAKPPAEMTDFIQNQTDWDIQNNVVDWECEVYKTVPAVLHDFDQQPIGDDRPQDPFYGLLMLHRCLVSAAHREGYELHFPLYEFACAWYLNQQGKLTPEQINKLLFPAEELDLLGGITDIFKTLNEDDNFKKELQKLNLAVHPLLLSPVPVLSLVPILVTLAGQVFSFLKKHKSGDLTADYLRGRGLKNENLENILQLNPDKELIDALPSLFAADLNVAMKKLNQGERILILYRASTCYTELNTLSKKRIIN